MVYRFVAELLLKKILVNGEQLKEQFVSIPPEEGFEPIAGNIQKVKE
jgi:hypothetical protein